MPSRCRACGKLIFSTNAKNLFQQADKSLLHQIEALTGLFLLDQDEFPAEICEACELALSDAIALRVRIIRTQQLLLSSDSVEDAFQKLDVVKVENLYLEGEVNERTDETPIYDYRMNDPESDPLDHLNKVSAELAVEEQVVDPFQKCEPSIDESTSQTNVHDKARRPTSIFSLNFGPKVKQVPRNYCKKLSKEELAAHKRERRKRDCICEQCGRHFTCASNFKVHLLTHTGVKNYSCKLCPLKFYTPHLLRVHELGHNRPYKCRHCEKTYTDISGRLQHERNYHTNYKPFKCTNCDKTFAVINGLKKHMVTHSGIRNFHCKVCILSFKTNRHLAIHYQSKSHKQNVDNSAPLLNNDDIKNVLP